VDAAFLGRLDRPCRIAVQLAAQHAPVEEPFEDADVLRPGSCRSFAPFLVDELLQAFGPYWGFEVGELEVGIR
jgi:hypothetical protein